MDNKSFHISENPFFNFFINSPQAGLVVQKHDNSILYINYAAINQLNIDEKIIGTSFKKLAPDFDLNNIKPQKIYLSSDMSANEWEINYFDFPGNENYAAAFLNPSVNTNSENIVARESIKVLLNHLNDVLWTMDLTGKITYCTPNISELTGFSPKEIINQHFSKILSPNSLELAQKLFYEELPKELNGTINIPVRRIEIEQINKNGGTIWTEMILSLVRNNQGNIIEILGITKNIQHLKDRLSQFDQYFHLSPEPSVILNKLGFITSCNKALAEQAGMEMEKIIGKHFSQLPIFEIKHIPNYIKIFARLIQGKDVQPHKYSWIDKKGKIHEGIAHIGLIKSNSSIEGIQAVTTDITEMVQIETALKLSEEKYKRIFQNAPLGIFHFDKNGILTDCNSKFVEIIGSSKEVLIGLDLLHQIKDERIIKGIKKTLKEGQAEFEGYYTSVTANKTTAVRLIFEGLLNDAEKIIGGVGIIEDIHARKMAEEELLEKNKKIAIQNQEYLAVNEELQKTLLEIQKINTELELAKNKAEQSDKLKTAFLQNMSHEIRTPMIGIIGFAQLLEMEDVISKNQKNYIKIIKESSNQLLSIVNDLLDISKIESGSMVLREQDVDLKTLLLDLYYFFKPNAKNNNLELSEPVVNSAIALVKTDPDKLRQVLNNLLSNAIKYSDSGVINFGYTINNNKLEFFVKDEGIGIKPESHNLVFERFHQELVKPVHSYGGTGLGLSISKGLIDLLGGEIWVNSEFGKGSTFYFTIPLKKV